MTTSFIQDGKLDREAVSGALRQFLDTVIKHARLALSYTVRFETAPDADAALGRAEIIVDFRSQDQDLLLAHNAELLKALEHLSLRALRIEPHFHDHVRFDCGDYRALRLEELKLAAKVAAERVRETRQPFRLNPMSSRERRIVHLALKEVSGVRTSSEGAGDDRQVVIHPADKT